MSLLRGTLNQTATYWGNPEDDGYGGKTYDSPVTIAVRWEEKQEQFITPDSETKISQAVIRLDQDVDVGGYLLLGESAEADPETLQDAYRIMAFSKIPDLRSLSHVRKVYL